MSGPELVYSVLQEGAHDIRDAAGKLRTERTAINDAFRAVVGSDWTGAAAQSFKEVFDHWHTGLSQVEEGLAAMGELIDATRKDFVETDDDVTNNVDAVAARLNSRLGG